MNHDSMYSHRERIYLLTSMFHETGDEPIKGYPSIQSAYFPFLKNRIAGNGEVVRSYNRLHFIAADNRYHNLSVRFVDPEFTRTFNFNYIHGDSTALDDPNGLILTRSIAEQFFGSVNVLGKNVLLENKYELVVKAVIENEKADSHFNSDFRPGYSLKLLAPIQALVALGEMHEKGAWTDEFDEDAMYVLLSKSKSKDQGWLQKQLDTLFNNQAPAFEKEAIRGLKARPLIEVNTIVWESMGFPVLESVKLLGVLVLIIACVNYTNIAAAQSVGRYKEVGLRKTFGARKRHLLFQFLIESILLSTFSMLLAIGGVEILIPIYNQWSGKELVLDYWCHLPFASFLTVFVGVMAGAYPAYRISKLNPIESLTKKPMSGRKGNLLRSIMIAAQFAVSIVILAMGMIIYFQNEKTVMLSDVFPRKDIVVVDKVNSDELRSKQQELKMRISEIEGVKQFTYSSEIPFNSLLGAPAKISNHRDTGSFNVYMDIVSINTSFMQTYNIPLLYGRALNFEDSATSEQSEYAVIVNEYTIQKLGYIEPEKALNKTFYKKRNGIITAYKIVGIMKNTHFTGPYNKIRAMAFLIDPELYYFISIKIDNVNRNEILEKVDEEWGEVTDNYPIRRRNLDYFLNVFFSLIEGIYNVMIVFAFITLALALTGLFGLAAFMAQQRSREIGIRKVMGASTFQVVRLLIWHFSIPVFWSLLIAVPYTYFVSSIYLDFFSEAIGFVIPIIILACALAILSAWITIAFHAINIARTKPIKVLRHE